MWSRLPRPRAVLDSCGRALRRSVPAMIASVAITGVGTGVWFGYRFVTTSERFAITAIEVRGEHHLTEDQVRAAMPVQLGDNVFSTNLGDLAAALEATPWIADADVHRVLPHTLVVEIREHAPAAVVELGQLYLVDAAGHPFKRAQLDAGDGADLPVITGISRESYERDPATTAATITEALAALAAWRTNPQRPAIGEIHVDAHRTLTLRTYDHAAAIELGTLGTDLAVRMRTFDAAWASLDATERTRTSSFHLDASSDRVTVAFHPVIASAKD
ncbi:MAG: FtsQ-type POTRA domain-containing protein [Kofleriaceae bacterium]|nr:FtsQ-type POTRA domain-containing protein [Kofleriaceae bacterium]